MSKFIRFNYGLTSSVVIAVSQIQSVALLIKNHDLATIKIICSSGDVYEKDIHSSYTRKIDIIANYNALLSYIGCAALADYNNTDIADEKVREIFMEKLENSLKNDALYRKIHNFDDLNDEKIEAKYKQDYADNLHTCRVLNTPPVELC